MGALGMIALGLIMMGFGQMFGALKEIALNSRSLVFASNPASVTTRDTYSGLGFINTCITIVGVLMGIFGVIGGLIGVLAALAR